MKISRAGELFLFTVMLFAASVGDEQKRQISSSDSAGRIRNLDNEWLTASDSCDRKTILNVFAVNLRMIHSDGRIATKSNELTNVKSVLPPEVDAKWKAEQIDVRIYDQPAVCIDDQPAVSIWCCDSGRKV